MPLPLDKTLKLVAIAAAATALLAGCNEPAPAPEKAQKPALVAPKAEVPAPGPQAPVGGASSQGTTTESEPSKPVAAPAPPPQPPRPPVVT